MRLVFTLLLSVLGGIAAADQIDASIGPVPLQDFLQLPECRLADFDAGEFDDASVRFEGFRRESKPGYAISEPYSMVADGREKTVTARIVFEQPAQAVGMALLFATGTLTVEGFDADGNSLFRCEQNGQGDPENNGTWMDYFLGYQARNLRDQVAVIEFSRSNLAEGTIPEFAVDDLRFVPGTAAPAIVEPRAVASDYSALGAAGMTSTAPQKPGREATVEYDGGVLSLSGVSDRTLYRYRLVPEAGLTSLTAEVGDGPAVGLGSDWSIQLGGDTVQQRLTGVDIAGGKAVLTYLWQAGSAELPVSVALSLSGGTLLVDLDSSSGGAVTVKRPLLPQAVMLSDGGDTAMRGGEALAFFGFGGDIGYLPEQRLFYSYQPDWTTSNATSPLPDIHYQSRHDGTFAPLSESIAVTVADALDKVLPSIPNPVSPYRELLASSVVMEFWYGHFAELAELLERYHQYGMDDLIVIVHRWQNAGFDRKYPDILPPSPARGGLETLRAAIATANANGQRVALHENYKDFYPDAPSWNPDDLLMTADGGHQAAWADAREMAPSKIRKYAFPVMSEIKETLNPTACFLDVHSTHLPWWRVDFRPGAPGEAQARGTLEPTDDLWRMAREIYGGPVIGECFNLTSWIHSGNIDSVMGQSSHNASLILDFLLLKIRPLATNHGAGYFERWNPRGYVLDWPSCPLPAAEYARYSLQEVAFQTAPTIDDKIKQEILPASVQYYQKRELVRRLAGQPVARIDYYTLDGEKLTSSQAVFRPKAEIQRLALSFADGSVIRLNFADTPWQLEDGSEVMPLGFKASGSDFSAETNRAGDAFFDAWRGPDSHYLNSRNHDWLLEPQGSAMMGRVEGGEPAYCSDGSAVVRYGVLATDTAVSLTREGDAAWRLRFFPRSQAGFAGIDLKQFGPVTEVVALDRDGRVVPEHGDKVTRSGDTLRIDHRDVKVWSYRLR